MEVNTVEELHGLLKQTKHSNIGDMRDNKGSTPKICPYCLEKKYPVHKKGGVIFYVGCKCHTGHPYYKKEIK